jgi:type II secretory pathway component GspD/PulD (secretin)/tetratricopeptide (TPR) repeat protein
MHSGPLRSLLALFSCWLLACPSLPAQTTSQSAAQSSNPAPAQTASQIQDPRALVKPDPKRAKKLAELGATHEAAGDYEGALEAYEEAARYAPFDANIVNKAVTLRSRLVRGYVDDGERLAREGDLNGAAEAFAFALHVDPSNAVLMERLKQIESMHEDEKEVPDEPAVGLPQVAPQKVTQSFNLRTDLRSAFEQVAASYGIKAAFDPDLPARNVRLQLNNVDFDTAIKVLVAETGTSWRPLNPKLIFVFADTAEKRRSYDMEIEQTFPLPTSADPAEVTELVRAIRELTGVQHIQQSTPSHTITIRDTVQRVKLAGAIIRQVEQARGEVLLEIDILEVNRSKALTLGITPPSSLQLITLTPGLANQVRSAQSVTALLTILATIFGGPLAAAAAGGGIASLAASIPPIAAIGGGKSTFLLTLPSFSADFSEGLSLVMSGKEVLLRAQDGKPATFFVGDRYPITLSLLSGSLGSTPFTANPGGVGVAIPTQQFEVGQGPVSLVTADFRNAGTQDLAVLNQIDNTVTIFLNQGTGAASLFLQATNSPISLGAARTTTPVVPAAIASAPVNTKNNSFPDLLVTDPVGNTVTVLLGNGDGTFGLVKTPIAVGNQPSAIATGTFNVKTDSNTGFVVTNFKDNSYSVFNGNGDGTFAQVKGSPFLLPNSVTSPIALTVADFNSDGFSDLAIVDQGTNQVTLLQGVGDGTFKEFPGSPIAVGKFPVAIANGSLNGSTGPGLAVVNQDDNSVTVLLGNGDGTFLQAAGSPLATSTTPSGVVIGNFLQQANSGIAVTNTAAGTVSVYVDLGSGLIKAVEPAAGTNPLAIISGDFTGSTFPDIVVTNNISGAAGDVTLVVSPTSLISNPATNQQPYPGSEYQDIGLKIKATPSLHENSEVTLQLDFDIKSLAGTSINGIPVISSRTLTQTVRLKEDQTSLLTGLLNRQETKTITGIPGLAPLPVIGYAFGKRDDSLTDNELLILVTPRRVRMPSRISKTIYAGRGDTGGRGSVGGNAPPAAIPEPEPQPQPVQPLLEPPAAQPAPQPTPDQSNPGTPQPPQVPPQQQPETEQPPPQ